MENNKAITCNFKVKAQTPYGEKEVVYEYETLFKVPAGYTYPKISFNKDELGQKIRELKKHGENLVNLHPHESNPNVFIWHGINGYLTFPNIATFHFYHVLNEFITEKEKKNQPKGDVIDIAFEAEYLPESVNVE